jgi:hypothetical protein
VAGTIGAVGNNGIGITGVAWRVKMLPCKFLDGDGEGSTASALACMEYIAALKDRGVNIIATNNSWGSRENSRALEDAIRAHRDRGILFVAAAGNEAEDVDEQPEYPCSHPVSNVLCVASTYESISFRFSNFGDATVHLGAPGESIYSTVPGNAYDWNDGTSMAAPHVTGTLVLLAAQDATRSWSQLRNLVIAGAVKPAEWSMRSVADGRLDALSSMTCTDREVLGALQPANFEELHRAVGDRVLIRALHIRCGDAAGTVAVTVSPGGELVTLRDDGSGVDEIAGDGEYAGQWVAASAGRFSFAFPAPETESFSVFVDEQLEPGFPVSQYRMQVFGLPSDGDLAIGNVDATPQLEIISLQPSLGPTVVRGVDGVIKPGWPSYDVSPSRSLALGEFDGDADSLEIVANYPFVGSMLYDGDGSRFPNWPQSQRLELLSTVDLDDDGIDEIIGSPALRVDGSRFNASLEIPARPEDSGGVIYAPAVGDLDADGSPEFVATSTSGPGNRLWISGVAGLARGYPIPAPGTPMFGSLPVIGDVDADGRPNIVIVWMYHENGAPVSRLVIHDNRGAVLRTIPVPGNIWSVSLGDLDADGFPEILVAGDTHVHAFKGDGSVVPGWPVTEPEDRFLASDLAVGDVDGDGRSDVIAIAVAGGPITQAYFHIHALRHDGTHVAGFPKTIETVESYALSPAIADIDLDGRNEIIAHVLPGPGQRQNIFVYDTHGSGPYGGIEWSEHRGGSARRGYYETGKNLSAEAFVAVQVYGAGSVASAEGRIHCGARCIGKFARGSNVTLTATAGSGGEFAGWRGACAGQGNPCTLPVNSWRETSANFGSRVAVEIAGSGEGSVSSDVAGITCPANCSASFPARSHVTLTASTPAGNAFESWSGACTGTQPTCTLFIDEAKSVVARFTNRHAFTITRQGNGFANIASVGPGVSCSAASCTTQHVPGSVLDLIISATADSYIDQVAYPGCLPYLPACRVTMNGPQTLSYVAKLKPVVTASVVGGGVVRSRSAGIDCPTTCSAPFAIGSVELYTVDNPGWHFVRWEGACAQLGFCNVYLDRDMSVTAVFERNPELAITFAGNGGGRVTDPGGTFACIAACTRSLETPRLVSLTAVPDAGSTFAGWGGACSGTAPNCELTFQAATTVTVTFTRASSGGSVGGGSAGKSGGRTGVLELMALALILVLSSAQRLLERLRRLRKPDGPIGAHVEAVLEAHTELPR